MFSYQLHCTSYFTGTVHINKHCCKYVRVQQETVVPLQPLDKYNKVNLNKRLGLKHKVILMV